MWGVELEPARDAAPLDQAPQALAPTRGLRASDQPAALVSGKTRHFLVYHNYDVLLDYNCAHPYALSVGLLADRIQ